MIWVLYICVLTSNGAERCLLEQTHRQESYLRCMAVLEAAKLPERTIALCRLEPEKK